MPSRRTFLTGLLAATVVAPIRRSWADGGLRCHLCSGQQGEKVCRLVCEEKKVQVVVWGVKCEEFCTPDPSCPDHEHCETICASVKPSDPCSAPKAFRWIHWQPAECGTVHTKKKLMKKTVTKTIPSYKWVVEDLCPACQTRCAQLAIPKDAEIPATPQLMGVVTLPFSR